MSAQALSVLCYWACKAGLLHARVKLIGAPPGRDSGSYQKRLDKRLGYTATKRNCYELDVVGQRKHDVGRTNYPLAVKTLHESAARIISEDGTLLTRLQEAVDDRKLPPVYFDNPVVCGTDDLVMPWGIYADGVPYSLTDSVLAIWLFNIISGARDCIAIFRKLVTCQCGCRGWCTYFPLL